VTVAEVRRFNRFYTRRLGLLRERELYSPWSLAEARVLYELASRGAAGAAQLGRDLGIDPGYLSRTLAGLECRGLVARTPSPDDGRRRVLTLTPAGRETFARLDARSRDHVAGLLDGLGRHERERLVGALATVESLLDDAGARPPEPVLRGPRPGDLGWVVERHGALYAAEYGFDAEFEALVAEIVAQVARDGDRARDLRVIAEVGGVRAGCVFCVGTPDRDVAKLRLLLVEPWARGGGLGARLVDASVAHARQAGYARLVLWTNDVLVAARRLYVRAGFELVASEPHRSFGHDLVGETWELAL
jgi:DNA-binding MarR family transcriptional regulator/N-acetylglutamate synthase-like GNAT family acetyltransferase